MAGYLVVIVPVVFLGCFCPCFTSASCLKHHIQVIILYSKYNHNRDRARRRGVEENRRHLEAKRADAAIRQLAESLAEARQRLAHLDQGNYL